MSYSYRYTFIEHLLSIKDEIISEVTSSGFDSGIVDPADVEDFIYERKTHLSHFFSRLHMSLSEAPYSMHFYLTFSKELIRGDGNNGNGHSGNGAAAFEEEIEVLRKTLRNIKDTDIEVFLHYNTEVAVQIVNDLVDEPGSSAVGSHPTKSPSSSQLSNAIDRETKSLATRIKKCPHYKTYKNYYASMISSSGLKNL